LAKGRTARQRRNVYQDEKNDEKTKGSRGEGGRNTRREGEKFKNVVINDAKKYSFSNMSKTPRGRKAGAKKFYVVQIRKRIGEMVNLRHDEKWSGGSSRKEADRSSSTQRKSKRGNNGRRGGFSRVIWGVAVVRRRESDRSTNHRTRKTSRKEEKRKPKGSKDLQGAYKENSRTGGGSPKRKQSRS